MQYGNIAKANDPFGVLLKIFEVYLVNNAAHAIPSASAQDCFHCIIIQHCLEITQALFISTGEISVGIAAQCGAHLYLIAPLLQVSIQVCALAAAI